MKNLDKYTLGKTPAAIYLIDYLNTEATYMDRNVLKFIATFKKTFRELLTAVETGHVSTSTLVSFCSLKRASMRAEADMHASNGISTLAIQLYQNLILADIKSTERKAMILSRVVRSSITQAKNKVAELCPTHLEGCIGTEVHVTTPKIENHSYKVRVYVGSTTNHVRQYAKLADMIDDTTAATLQAKSSKKLAKRGKVNTFY